MDPLSQFKVFTVFELPKVFGFNIDFTNSALYMFISILTCMVFLLGIIKVNSKDNRILSLWQFAVDRFYNFIVNIVKENGGEHA
ncbi:MAG: F0F1 ATP synthase subunit A, partial [Anaplasmataceae bacterium]|nr:F0F1 ATP synthase subunit A [Anaplasmataceae bacterium]